LRLGAGPAFLLLALLLLPLLLMFLTAAVAASAPACPAVLVRIPAAMLQRRHAPMHDARRRHFAQQRFAACRIVRGGRMHGVLEARATVHPRRMQMGLPAPHLYLILRMRVVDRRLRGGMVPGSFNAHGACLVSCAARVTTAPRV
jgi:hypothetical protein